MAEKGSEVIEVHIGVTDVSREIIIEIESTQDEITKLVNTAVTTGEPLELTDEKGRRVVVPAEKIGFVEIGSSVGRRLGFGAA
jgi:hypothetical protein